jgi:hypothetical protein
MRHIQAQFPSPRFDLAQTHAMASPNRVRVPDLVIINGSGLVARQTSGSNNGRPLMKGTSINLCCSVLGAIDVRLAGKVIAGSQGDQGRGRWADGKRGKLPSSWRWWSLSALVRALPMLQRVHARRS